MKLIWDASNKQKATALYATAGVSFVGWLAYAFGFAGILFLIVVFTLIAAAHFEDKKDDKGVDNQNSGA
jgi:hypothetical protein